MGDVLILFSNSFIGLLKYSTSIFFHSALFLSYCLAKLPPPGSDLILLALFPTGHEAFTLKKSGVCTSYLASELMSDVHLKCQTWTPALPSNLLHLQPCLAQFMTSPSFLLFTSKIYELFYILLFLLWHMTSNQSGSLVGPISNIYSESDRRPLTPSTFASLVPAIVTWITVITFYSQHFIMKIIKYTTKLKEFYTNSCILNP